MNAAHRRKLTDAQVLQIRRAWARGGATTRELRERYGIANISDIITGQSYRWVGGPTHKPGKGRRRAQPKPRPTRAERHAAAEAKQSRVADRTRARFLARCDRSAGPDACWPWTGGIDPAPVSTQHFGRLTITRGAWFLAYGKLPRKGLLVVRRCTTPGCANVLHMGLGTRKDRVLPRPAPWRGRESDVLAARLRALGEFVVVPGLTRKDIGRCLMHLARSAKAPSVAAFLRRERRRAGL